MQSQPIYVNGKRVYEVTADGKLCKRVRNNHFLKRPRALGADVDVLNEAIDIGATSCEFRHIETGDVYRCDIDLMRNHSILLNRRYGAQRALPLEYWSINSQPPRKRPVSLIESEKPEATQLSLFACA